ncbi:MAG: PaaI family thioesterase [Acidobacteriota bacterium]|nr:PaaI family thioesterase [Acidobacteriota bacterium]
MNRWHQLLDGLVAGSPPGDLPPFVKNMNMPQPTYWEKGLLRSTWDIDPNFFHERQALFGGYLAALADNILALVTMTVLESDDHFATSDLHTNFYRPIFGKILTIEAKVIYRGRRMVHTEAFFTRDDGKPAAKATATQVIHKA